jgi:hypothetical protein
VDSRNGKIDSSAVKEAEDSIDVKEVVQAGDESQVLQTVTVIMNMPDVTKLDTLNDEQKKEV